MRSLVDMLGASASRAESALGDSAPADAWHTIMDTVTNLPSASLPPIPAVPSINAHPSDTDAAQGDAQKLPMPIQPSAYTMRGLNQLPLDLSLKTQMRIFSQTSLVWTRVRPQRDDHRAMRDVLENHDLTINPSHFQFYSPANRTNPPQALQTAARCLFYRRLLHFRFPTSPLHSSLAQNWHNVFSTDIERTSQADSTVRSRRAHAISRLEKWQNALQSLYYGFRYRYVPNFYVLLPGSVVVFKRLDDERVTPVAVLSPATPGLRSLLSDYVVPFTICRPDMESSNSISVRVEGDYGVHTLYNFIMCAAHKLSGATDVPTLVADQPFREGTVVTADVHYAKEARVLDPSSPNMSTRFSVEVHGLLTPRQVSGICDALVYTQGAQYIAVLDTERRCAGVNNMHMPDKDAVRESLSADQLLDRIAAFPENTGLYAIVRHGEG